MDYAEKLRRMGEETAELTASYSPFFDRINSGDETAKADLLHDLKADYKAIFQSQNFTKDELIAEFPQYAVNVKQLVWAANYLKNMGVDVGELGNL